MSLLCDAAIYSYCVISIIATFIAAFLLGAFFQSKARVGKRRPKSE